MFAALGSKLALYCGVAAIALIAFGGLWMLHLHDQAKIAELTAANATLVAVNASNVAELAKIQSDAAKEVSALKSDSARTATLASKKDVIHQEIANAVDAPLPAVLADTVRSLFQPAAPSGANQGSAPAH